jgi:hypothetical protein
MPIEIISPGRKADSKPGKKQNDKTLYVCITISILVIDAYGNYLERS